MSIEQVLRGVWHGYDGYHEREDEKVARTGGRWPDTSQHQAELLLETLSTASEVTSLLLGRTIPTYLRVCGIVFPYFLWFAHTKTVKKPESLANRSINFVHHHIGHFCFAVSLIDNLTLIRHGKAIQGSIALGFTLFGLVDTRLPHFVRNPVRVIAHPLHLVGALTYGDRLDRAVALLNGAAYVHSFWPERNPGKPALVEIDINKPDQYREEDLEVNWWHIRAYRPTKVPKGPDVDLAGFSALFGAINWKESSAKDTLGKLCMGEKWGKGQEGEDKGLDAERKIKSAPDGYEEYARQGMKRFVAVLKQETSPPGDLTDWKTVIDQAKHVLQKLQGMSQEDQAGPLATLAVAAGQSCGAGYDAVSQVYSDLARVPAPTLEGQLGEACAEMRAALFSKLVNQRYHECSMWRYHLLLLDPTDVHTQNLHAAIFGRQLGHPRKEEARQDPHAVGHVVDKILGRLIWWDLPSKFRQEYTAEKVIDSAYAAIPPLGAKPDDEKGGKYLVSNEFINKWLSTKCDDDFDFKLLRENGVLKREYVRLLLLDLGFLQPQTRS